MGHMYKISTSALLPKHFFFFFGQPADQIIFHSSEMKSGKKGIALWWGSFPLEGLHFIIIIIIWICCPLT